MASLVYLIRMTRLNKKDFFYHLPEELIAQSPITPRDSARLLCFNRIAQEIEHKRFYDLPKILKKGDLLVINTTRVLPARIYGTKEPTGANVEFLLHKRISLTDWEIICRPSKRLKAGTRVRFSDGLSAIILQDLSDGGKLARFVFSGVFEEELNKIGEMPLPPYINTKLDDKDRYQTVYAKIDGSSAAPTAGLHFTPQLIEKLKQMGIEFASVVLNVGLGTFRPVKSDDITQHKMHSEYFVIDKEAADKVNTAKKEGRRVIAVGTTSVRVLESAASNKGEVRPLAGETNIFIYPPYQFRVIDGLITNFHLPESTLIMLVSAFIGREKTLELYKCAVENKYRFFSFGDAMILL